MKYVVDFHPKHQRLSCPEPVSELMITARRSSDSTEGMLAASRVLQQTHCKYANAIDSPDVFRIIDNMIYIYTHIIYSIYTLELPSNAGEDTFTARCTVGIPTKSKLVFFKHKGTSQGSTTSTALQRTCIWGHDSMVYNSQRIITHSSIAFDFRTNHRKHSVITAAPGFS